MKTNKGKPDQDFRKFPENKNKKELNWTRTINLWIKASTLQLSNPAKVFQIVRHFEETVKRSHSVRALFISLKIKKKFFSTIIGCMERAWGVIPKGPLLFTVKCLQLEPSPQETCVNYLGPPPSTKLDSSDRRAPLRYSRGLGLESRSMKVLRGWKS